MKLYCATSNPGKLREFRQAAQCEVEIEPIFVEAPEETGSTFEENATAKALYYSRHAPGRIFADDSGLEVDALGGEPGVHSARFAGPEADSEMNNRLLIARLQGVENRKARFVCVVALAEQGRLIGTFRGEVEGRIVDEGRGTNGFGYDPYFYSEPFGCTLGEADAERKFEVSHRGRALRAMLATTA